MSATERLLASSGGSDTILHDEHAAESAESFEETRHYIERTVFFYAGIFLAAAAVEWGISKLPAYRPPVSVSLYALGVGLSFWGYYRYLPGGFDLALEEAMTIHPHTILFIFLPVILYKSAVSMNPHVFRKVLPSAFIMAIVGVIIQIYLLAVFIWQVLDGLFTWNISLMMASALTPTDPVAVVAALESLGAPAKLAALIEGESLLNDGSAAVFFFLFREIASNREATACDVKGNAENPLYALGFFFQLAVGGPALGVAFAAVVKVWLVLARLGTVIEVTVVVGTLYLTFWVAETVHVSGVLAAVCYGLYFAESGRLQMSRDMQHVHDAAVETLERVANQGIFVLSGIVSAHKWISSGVAIQPGVWLNLFLLFLVMQAARALVLLLLSPGLRQLGYGLTVKEGIISWWGGLRGAVGLALALIVQGDAGCFTSDTRDLMTFYVTMVIALMLVTNGMSIEPMYQWLDVYPSNPFRKVYLQKILQQIEEEYEEKKTLVKSHWLFRCKSVIDLADLMVPDLRKAKIDASRMTIEVKLPSVRKVIAATQCKKKGLGKGTTFFGHGHTPGATESPRREDGTRPPDGPASLFVPEAGPEEGGGFPSPGPFHLPSTASAPIALGRQFSPAQLSDGVQSVNSPPVLAIRRGSLGVTGQTSGHPNLLSDSVGQFLHRRRSSVNSVDFPGTHHPHHFQTTTDANGHVSPRRHSLLASLDGGGALGASAQASGLASPRRHSLIEGAAGGTHALSGHEATRPTQPPPEPHRSPHRPRTIDQVADHPGDNPEDPDASPVVPEESNATEAQQRAPLQFTQPDSTHQAPPPDPPPNNVNDKDPSPQADSESPQRSQSQKEPKRPSVNFATSAHSPRMASAPTGPDLRAAVHAAAAENSAQASMLMEAIGVRGAGMMTPSAASRPKIVPAYNRSNSQNKDKPSEARTVDQQEKDKQRDFGAAPSKTAAPPGGPSSSVTPKPQKDATAIPSKSQNGSVIPPKSQNGSIIPQKSQNGSIIPQKSQDGSIIPSKNGSVIPPLSVGSAVLSKSQSIGSSERGEGRERSAERQFSGMPDRLLSGVPESLSGLRRDLSAGSSGMEGRASEAEVCFEALQREAELAHVVLNACRQLYRQLYESGGIEGGALIELLEGVDSAQDAVELQVKALESLEQNKGEICEAVNEQVKEEVIPCMQQHGLIEAGSVGDLEEGSQDMQRVKHVAAQRVLERIGLQQTHGQTAAVPAGQGVVPVQVPVGGAVGRSASGGAGMTVPRAMSAPMQEQDNVGDDDEDGGFVQFQREQQERTGQVIYRELSRLTDIEKERIAGGRFRIPKMKTEGVDRKQSGAMRQFSGMFAFWNARPTRAKRHVKEASLTLNPFEVEFTVIKANLVTLGSKRRRLASLCLDLNAKCSWRCPPLGCLGTVVTFPLILRDLEVLLAFVTVHENLYGFATQNGLHDFMGMLLLEALKSHVEAAQQTTVSLYRKYPKLFAAALTLLAGRMLVNIKRTIVKEFSENGVIQHEEEEQILHEILDQQLKNIGAFHMWDCRGRFSRGGH
uniref:Cation/H+ exchanger transmembrane domain-containing protein n=1 Tax=Chromera velia CCMP2878 TaxID=1169474 RepID=A0A0G4H9L9_9ALVE|eukprot:Cvel_25332.t1-p1 / transcript=Cvel_25332.t1 / gene=Cvel_25332 / organism=Chromera_velia_CCMP2878 / gene_product=Sodium/hydrogen exchanger 7, putative / transcript_product=Sodium/hydrogen exchanger 7, putative / location=Cvel_scaffold2855:1610-14443(-) / protein_length=1534 / sequence_SO=supercontig / SO=protein_coding / is_pseudo=false